MDLDNKGSPVVSSEADAFLLLASQKRLAKARERLQFCRDAASHEPFSRELRLEVVSALTDLCNEDESYRGSLRHSRQKVSSMYALSVEVWMPWITHEMKHLNALRSKGSFGSGAQSDDFVDTFDTVIQMLESCLKDSNGYGTVTLWQLYLDFITKIGGDIGCIAQSKQIAEMCSDARIGDCKDGSEVTRARLLRSIYQRAVSTVGYSFVGADSIWEGFIEFENSILRSLVQRATASISTADDSGDKTPELAVIGDSDDDDDTDAVPKEIEKQVAVIRKLKRRRVGIAHIGVEDWYKQYQQWECKMMEAPANDRGITDAYKKSKQVSTHLKKIERKLTAVFETDQTADNSLAAKLPIWREYILKADKLNNHKQNAVRSLWNRYLHDAYTIDDVWVKFADWLQKKHLKNEAVALLKNASRFHPHSAKIWIALIDALEFDVRPLRELESEVISRVFPEMVSAATETESVSVPMEDASNDVEMADTSADVVDSGAKKSAETMSSVSKKKKRKKRRKHDATSDLVPVKFASAGDYVALSLAIARHLKRKCGMAVDRRYELGSACLLPATAGIHTDLLKQLKAWQKHTVHLLQKMAASRKMNSDTEVAILANLLVSSVQFYCDLYSRFLADYGLCRNLWETALKLCGKHWSVWIAAIEWEQAYGELLPVKPSQKAMKGSKSTATFVDADSICRNIKYGLRNVYRIRHLFRRAMAVVTYECGLAYVTNKYTQFEESVGDLISIRDVKQSIAERMAKETLRVEKDAKARAKREARKSAQRMAAGIGAVAAVPSFQGAESEVATTTRVDSTSMAMDSTLRSKRSLSSMKKTTAPMATDSTMEDLSDVNLDATREIKRRRVEESEMATTGQRTADLELDKSALSEATDGGWQAAATGEAEFRGTTETRGRKIYGTKAQRTVFVLNFRKNCAEDALRQLFGKYGRIMDMRLPRSEASKKHPTRKWKGFGYVEFSDRKEAEKCIQRLHKSLFQGVKLTVQQYRDKSAPTECLVYVKGLKHLSHGDAELCIKQVLAECGQIEEIRLTKDTRFEGRETLKGFAYVQLSTAQMATRALTKDKTLWRGRVIEVKEHVKAGKRKAKQRKEASGEPKDDVEMAQKTQSSGAAAVSTKRSVMKPRSVRQSSAPKTAPMQSNDDFRKLLGL